MEMLFVAVVRFMDEGMKKAGSAHGTIRLFDVLVGVRGFEPPASTSRT
jgi:hypothetical protein